jgi:hypothetical protein
VNAVIPGGSAVDKNGTITVGDGRAEIKLPGNTIVDVPQGATVTPDGKAEIPKGSGGSSVTHSSGHTFSVPEDTVMIFDEDTPLGYYVNTYNSFTDVKKDDWFCDDVIFVYTHGLMTGTAADKFSPNAHTTRGMIVTGLFRLAAPAKGANTTDFTDIPLGQYYSDAVAWAAENRLVGGVGGGRFAPDANITRQDLAVILTRYAEYKGVTLAAIREYAAFSDDSDISDYAKMAVEACYRAGIISGKPGNLFDPKGTATRAEVAAMLHRFIIVISAGE